MAVAQTPPSAGPERPIGYGRLQRKEDARFIRGPGAFVDDVQLPRDAPRRDPAQPARARPHRLDRHLRRARSPRRCTPVITGRDLEARGLAWMPTMSARHPGRARDRQGPLPGPGGGVRDRRRPLFGARRDRADRGRVRAARARSSTPPGAGRRHAGDPRRARGPRRQPPLRLGGRRRCARPTRAFAERRHRRRAGDGLPALAPRADGDVWCRGRLRPHRRQAHDVVHDPGAARAPHAVRLHHRAARTHDPRDLARRRRRLRQQGAGVSGLRVRDRRRDGHRQAGEVDGGPLGEPHVDRVRARLRDEAARSPPTRDGPHPARSGWRCSPTTGRSTPPRSRPSSRPGSSTCSPGPTTSRPRTAASAACTRTRRPAASPTRARSASPRRVYLVERMVECLAGELGIDPAELRLRNLTAPDQFPYECTDRLGLRLWRLPRRAAQGDGQRRVRGAAPRAGARRERGELMGIGDLVLHRGGRRRPAQAHGHPRAGR